MTPNATNSFRSLQQQITPQMQQTRIPITPRQAITPQMQQTRIPIAPQMQQTRSHCFPSRQSNPRPTPQPSIIAQSTPCNQGKFIINKTSIYKILFSKYASSTLSRNSSL